MAADAAAAAEIAQAYASDGPAVDLGAVVIDGHAVADAQVRLPLAMMNRHGLVAGATGTGKTKTLQLIAEQLSAAGVPVLLTDIKGDLSGVAAPGQPSDRVTKRAAEVGAGDWAPAGAPVEFLTLGSDDSDPTGPNKTGTQLRATMTSFGPVLLSKALGLNDVQSSSLGLVFHWADKAGLPLLDLKDLRAVITHLTNEAGAAELASLGGLSKATAGVILRELIAFADQGGEQFFGEPEFDTAELLRTTGDGKGIVSVLELARVQDKPALFSTFLMWLLADLHHDLPEVGDLDRPKLVFFFDEAHLLFKDASKDFLEQIAQTVRLIRSKGVGVFFVTQVPTDVPPEVLAQLGNRVQHALRVFTPQDAKALSSTVSTFPRSKVYQLDELLPGLGIGEAVVTVLSETGAPTPVAWTRLRPPTSLMAQLDPAEQAKLVAASPIATKYATVIDRESAYEKLMGKVSGAAAEPAAAAESASPAPPPKGESVEDEHGLGDKVSEVLGSSAFKAFTRSIGSAVGREITRSLFGTARRRR
jgi:DNA helicase HerA-like ATPase